VVARAGRADVLKDLGRLDEALAAYEETIRDHPRDVVARNGRAGVLAALGRWDEALQSLPGDAPVARSDWITQHIRGMLLLTLGDLEQADAIFVDGTRNCPWPDQRAYFRSGVALVRLRRREFASVVEALQDITSPALDVPVNLIRLHAFGEEHERHRAIEAYQAVQADRRPLVYEVSEELRRRYITDDPPEHDEEWLFTHEVRAFLVA
jgi:tetratricopeptide (TPR) repeat protein